MEEQVLLDVGSTKVTTSRFIVGSQTFAMSNITSVKASQDEPNRLWPVLIGLLGLVSLSASKEFGGVLIGIAVIWFFLQKTQYHVVLTTAGGESKALSSDDKADITSVVQALNDAIVARG